MSMYFNHNCLENCSRETLPELIYEISELKGITQKSEEELYFCQDLWNIRVPQGVLRDYLYSLKDREIAKLLITAVMNGPYYFTDGCEGKVDVDPELTKGYLEGFLGICFRDNVSRVLSLKSEKDLREACYKICSFAGVKLNYEVWNIKGVEQLEKYLKDKCKFSSIEEAFDVLEEELPGVVILNSARKSAKKHDFRGGFKQIYETIKVLWQEELGMLLKGVSDEERKRILLENYGVDISRESIETLNIERYKREREFMLPSGRKKLFEWHAKLNVNHTRVYYYLDKKNKRLYIGHCGKHLGTFSYNS